MTTQPRFSELDLDAMPTAELIAYHEAIAKKRDAASNPIVHQALALRVYQVESAIAVRNAQVMADLDDAAEQRTVARIAEWLRLVAKRIHGRGEVVRGDAYQDAADAIETGTWRSR